MKCRKCNHVIPEDALFCSQCGANLKISCPSCRIDNTPGSRFCKNCGQKLQIVPHPGDEYENPRSYTPNNLIRKILSGGSRIEGERKLVTVFFADVAGFTAISEQNDPEDIRNIMDGCFDILMRHIHRYEGTITQFLGDGLMALFGAPISHEDHARRACLAALAAQKDLAAYGLQVTKEYGVDFKMRIGLNSGFVIVGSVGDDLRMDYTAVGDTVNLASRMETAARQGTVLISRNVHNLVKAYFEFRPRGKLELKGKKEAQEAYELLHPSEIDTRIAASASKGFTRFVGRKTAMGILSEAFEKAASGSGQVLGLVGDAGVGKSRLLIEFRNTLPPGEISYLEGQCFQYGGSIIYLPLLSIVKSCLAIEEDDHERVIRQKIDHYLKDQSRSYAEEIPPLQHLLSLPVDDAVFEGLEPKLKREKTFDAIRNLLIRESEVRPLVVAVDDLHWIDRTSEEFIDLLIGSIPGSRILLLLIYRPEYRHQWGSKSCYTQVRLDQLSEASSLELIQAILEEGEVAPELTNLIMEKAAGNPLYVEEFTRSLIENGTIEKIDRAYTINGEPSQIQVPDTIQGIIASRMDRLEEDLKRIMQVASVIGRGFAYRILQTITGQHEELKPFLYNLQGLEIIYEKQLFPELEYIFKHALIQEVAYNSLLQKRRREIHERIGNAIEEIYADRLEEYYEILVHHYSRSDDPDKTIHYLLLASDKARHNFAYKQELSFLHTALGIINEQHETDDTKRMKMVVFFAMFEPQMHLGFRKETLKMLLEGKQLAIELNDESSVNGFSQCITFFCSMTGTPLPDFEQAENNFQTALKSGSVNMAIPAGNSLAMAYFVENRLSNALDTSQEAIKLLENTESVSDDALLHGMDLYGRCAFIMSLYGKMNEAEQYGRRCLEATEKCINPFGRSLGQQWYGNVLMLKGQGHKAREHFERAIALAREVKNPRLINQIISSMSGVCLQVGDFEGAIANLKQGMDETMRMVPPSTIAWNSLNLAILGIEMNCPEDAIEYASKVFELSQVNKNLFLDGRPEIVYGHALLKAGQADYADAEKYVLEGIRLLENTEYKLIKALGLCDLCLFYLDADNQDEVLKYSKQLALLCDEMELDFYRARMHEILHRLHKTSGESSEAREQLEKAIEIMKKLEAYGWVERYEMNLVELA